MAMEYIGASHPLELESDYPYTALGFKACQYDASKGKVSVHSKKSYTVVPQDEA